MTELAQSRHLGRGPVTSGLPQLRTQPCTVIIDAMCQPRKSVVVHETRTKYPKQHELRRTPFRIWLFSSLLLLQIRPHLATGWTDKRPGLQARSPSRFAARRNAGLTRPRRPPAIRRSLAARSSACWRNAPKKQQSDHRFQNTHGMTPFRFNCGRRRKKNYTHRRSKLNWGAAGTVNRTVLAVSRHFWSSPISRHSKRLQGCLKRAMNRRTALQIILSVRAPLP